MRHLQKAMPKKNPDRQGGDACALFKLVRVPFLTVGVLCSLFACEHKLNTPSPTLPSQNPAPPVTLQKFSREKRLHTIEVSLIVYAPNEAQANVALDGGFARTEALFDMMDDYHLESPLNQFCAKAGQGPQKIAPELTQIFMQAKRMTALTEGNFDITFKPFVQLWRISREVGELPPPEAIAKARKIVGSDKLILHPENNTAELTQEGMWLDLGGIAKGFIADEAVRVMGEKGCPICACFNGGDRVFGDAPPDSPEGWSVDVPDAPVPLSFKVKNGAVSVSGDVFRYVEIDGVRYSHVIDPKTGLGLTTHKMACVRARRGMDADPLVKGGSLMEESAWKKAVAQVEGGQGWVFIRKP